MPRSVCNTVTIALLGLLAFACANEGVGDPCIPEAVPCDSQGENCGFRSSESYVEASSVQCRSRLCIVHKLDNRTEGTADPRLVDNNGDGIDDATGVPCNNRCVNNSHLDESIYCTCKCGGPKTREFCKCPSGFKCEQVLNNENAGKGIQGSYCVRDLQSI